MSEGGGTDGWHIIVVSVPLREDPQRGLRALRALQAWLSAHHRPVALFGADGRPRSAVVSLAFPVARADRTLAFKALCARLGIAAGLVQWRVAQPPPRSAAPTRLTG